MTAVFIDLDRHRRRRACEAAARQVALDRFTAGLIADFGHPQWPGWRLLLLLLLTLQIFLVAQQVTGAEVPEQIRPRAGAARRARAPGQRFHRRLALRGPRGLTSLQEVTS